MKLKVTKELMDQIAKSAVEAGVDPQMAKDPEMIALVLKVLERKIAEKIVD